MLPICKQRISGGILIENSSPTIDRNVIHNNTAGNCGGSGGGIAVLGSSYPYIFGNEIFDNTVQGDCDCICYFGGGIYVDSLAWPILGGSTTIGNVFHDNYADIGKELYKNFSVFDLLILTSKKEVYAMLQIFFWVLNIILL